MDCSQGHGDDTLFMKFLDSGIVMILLLHVNDIIMTDNNEEESKSLDERLTTLFEIKFRGKMRYFLGIETILTKASSFLSTSIPLISSRRRA